MRASILTRSTPLRWGACDDEHQAQGAGDDAGPVDLAGGTQTHDREHGEEDDGAAAQERGGLHRDMVQRLRHDMVETDGQGDQTSHEEQVTVDQEVAHREERRTCPADEVLDQPQAVVEVGPPQSSHEDEGRRQGRDIKPGQVLELGLGRRDGHDRLAQGHDDEQAESFHDVRDVVALSAHGPAVAQGATELDQRGEGPQHELAVAAQESTAQDERALDEAGRQVHAEGGAVLTAGQQEGDDQA